MAKKVIVEGELERRSSVFGVPLDGAGRVIVQFPLAWAWVEDRLQVVIDLPEVRYPKMVRATRVELLDLLGEEGAV